MSAVVEEAPAKPKGPSLVIQLGVLVALTLAVAGAGWFAGMQLGGKAAPPPATDAAAPAKEAKAEGGHGGGEAGAPEADPDSNELHEIRPGVVQLRPITTNLSAPSNVWVRMEVAIVFEGEVDMAMAESVHEDLMAYMRSLSLPQVEGATGFIHLKSDLEERAAIRSDGKVKQVLFRTLLFE